MVQWLTEYINLIHSTHNYLQLQLQGNQMLVPTCIYIIKNSKTFHFETEYHYVALASWNHVLQAGS